MKFTVLLLFAGFCSDSFGQTFSKADKILQSAETAKTNLRKSYDDLGKHLFRIDLSAMADDVAEMENSINTLCILQGEAKIFLKGNHFPSVLGEIKRRQLRDFSREKFGAEHRELVRVRKRLRILLKGYELGTNNPELSFLSEIRA